MLPVHRLHTCYISHPPTVYCPCLQVRDIRCISGQPVHSVVVVLCHTIRRCRPQLPNPPIHRPVLIPLLPTQYAIRRVRNGSGQDLSSRICPTRTRGPCTPILCSGPLRTVHCALRRRRTSSLPLPLYFLPFWHHVLPDTFQNCKGMKNEVRPDLPHPVRTTMGSL